MIAALLALALAAAEADEPYDDAPADEERPPRMLVSVWGGGAFDTDEDEGSSSLFGAEAAWAFKALDLGVAGYAYRNLPDSTREWSPVVLLRLTQRFEARRGVEATFTVGLGAGREEGWEAWYLVAFGVRAGAGPLFLAGELGLEQLNQVRLTGGVGVRF